MAKKPPKITIAELESLGGNAMPESTTKSDLRALARDINGWNKSDGSHERDRQEILRDANELLGFHGVELVTYRSDGYDDTREGMAMEWKYDYGDDLFSYLNAGDTYAATLVYLPYDGEKMEHESNIFEVTTWGDVYEQIRSDTLMEAEREGGIDPEPDFDGDIFIVNHGRGYGEVSHAGKVIYKAKDDEGQGMYDDAIDAIGLWMDKNRYFPNVWLENERGDYTLVEEDWQEDPYEDVRDIY